LSSFGVKFWVVLRLHIFPISSQKRFSMSGIDPTNDLDIMARSFEKTFQTVEN
jgi:hypothetical protein